MAAYHKVEVALNKQSITVGSPSPQTVNVVVPTRGPKGDTGDTGPTGPANSLSIGTVTTGAEGDPAAATITGDAPNQTLSLTLPVGATGATGPQGPAGEQTTDASLLTSGTLADARLSANVPLKDAANTFSQNQTLDGTNSTAPNQTAASGSSIMTRQLTDDRYWTQPEFVTLNITNFTGATVGGNAGGQNSTLLTLSGQTIANVISSSHARIGQFPSTAGGRSTFNYSRKMRVKLVFQTAIGSGNLGVTAPDTVVHYIIPIASGYTDGQPSHRSFGFTVGPTTINGFTHDGTNYATTTTGVAWATTTIYYGVVENDGAGNYSFWLNSGSGLASLGTLTGPTGAHGAEHLFGANVKSTAIDNGSFFYSARSLEISMAAS